METPSLRGSLQKCVAKVKLVLEVCTSMGLVAR